MQERECTTDLNVAKGSQPAMTFGRQRLDVAPHRFHEHQFGQLGQRRLRAGPRSRGLEHTDAQQFAHQARGLAVAERNAQHARQRFEQRTTQAAAASEIAAHEASGGAAAAVLYRHEGRLDGHRCGGVDQVVGLQRGHVQVAAHQMPVVLRKQDQVAGANIDHLATFGQPHSASALREEVKQHDMFGACELLLDAGHAVPAAHAPRRGELGIEEDGAFESNRLENAGQGIHGAKEQRRSRRQQDRTAAQHTRRGAMA